MFSFIEQSESPDGGSSSSSSSKLSSTPAALDEKKKRKARTTKVNEVKSDEPVVTIISPKTKHATPSGLHPHHHSRGKVT